MQPIWTVLQRVGPNNLGLWSKAEQKTGKAALEKCEGLVADLQVTPTSHFQNRLAFSRSASPLGAPNCLAAACLITTVDPDCACKLSSSTEEFTARASKELNEAALQAGAAKLKKGQSSREKDREAVRAPSTTRTIIQQDGPNHLGLR